MMADIQILPLITEPSDVKLLTYEQLDCLASEIRSEMIRTVSHTGGHLASSLGSVEVILAVHRVIDAPKDHLIFDVGHQSYAHKMITGRYADFSTLRQYGGISGFPKRAESVYDVHNSGHASDSLSTALGLALARDLNGTNERIMTIIGDASISGGMAFEAMNQIGQLRAKMTIILNDNEMSISPNVGALSLYLGKIRLSQGYTLTRDTVEGRINSWGRVGKTMVDVGEAFKESFKKLVVPGTFFEDMGFTYIGPIDGHNIRDIEDTIRAAQDADGPVIIHVITRKGKGYLPAEERPERFHGVGAFDVATGELAKSPENSSKGYTETFSSCLMSYADHDSSIVAITAAMCSGTGLKAFGDRYPRRFFDVGIAEEHAVALASGFALGGKRPVIAMYSTFLQRAFDQTIINVALQRLPVIFAIDRAGLVGADGPTHHGMFDLAYMTMVPHMTVLAPSSVDELVRALDYAFLYTDGPIAIRYPRTPSGQVPTSGVWERGKGVRCRAGDSVAFLALGKMVAPALEAAELLAAEGIEAAVYDMRFAKPVDREAIREAASTHLIVTLEDGVITGGFNTQVTAALESLVITNKTKHVPVLPLGLPDEFMGQGNDEELFGEAGLLPDQIAAHVADVLSKLV
jgi:1-deoxy-D-xylulose-5-phosphate synthase